MRLEQLRDELECEHQGRCDDLEKKYAYKMEQLRQELADKHDQVVIQHKLPKNVCWVFFTIT